MESKLFGNIYANSKEVSLQARLRTVATNLETIGKSAVDFILSYYRQGSTAIQFVATDLPSIETMWIEGGVKEVEQTLSPGLYRIDVPDAAFIEGADWVIISAVVIGCYVFEERFNIQLRNDVPLSTGVLDNGFADTYISVTGADNYFATKLFVDVWDDANTADKTKALQQATRMIDHLLFIGEKTDPFQSLEFPRDPDIFVPDDIKIANAEIAYSLLDGVNIEKELEKLTTLSDTYNDTKTIYAHASFVPEWLRAGIPNATAWLYLKPYLLDSRKLNLTRVS